MKDDQKVQLLKESLTVIFGLKENTMHRVVKLIKSSADSSNIKTPNIRTRIGTRSMHFLKKAIKIAKHEGTEKREKEKSVDKSKRSNTKTDESLTFKEFLLNETMIDVDLKDQQSAISDLRKAQRLNKSSPDRLNRENTIKAKQEQRDAQQSAGDDPTSSLRQKIAKKKVELSMLNRRLTSATRQQNSANTQQGEV